MRTLLFLVAMCLFSSCNHTTEEDPLGIRSSPKEGIKLKIEVACKSKRTN